MSVLSHPEGAERPETKLEIRVKMEHPYKKFEGHQIWNSIGRALDDLEKNKDLEITTAREYVIGYLCKCLVDGFPTDEDGDSSTTPNG